RAVRGNRSPVGAEIPADRFRLAGRRARRRTVVCVAIPHGARGLAGGEGPAGRVVARKGPPRPRPRAAPRREEVHPPARGAADRGARPMGDGFYGVDLKQTESGIVVMEVNDNPSLEHGIEDSVGKDEIWMRLLRWFIDRFEQ